MKALAHERDRVREARISLGNKNLRTFGVTQGPCHPIGCQCDQPKKLTPRSVLVTRAASRFLLECGFDPITGDRILLPDFAAPIEDASKRLNEALLSIVVSGDAPQWKAPKWSKGDFAWLERTPE